MRPGKERPFFSEKSDTNALGSSFFGTRRTPAPSIRTARSFLCHLVRGLYRAWLRGRRQNLRSRIFCRAAVGASRTASAIRRFSVKTRRMAPLKGSNGPQRQGRDLGTLRAGRETTGVALAALARVDEPCGDASQNSSPRYRHRCAEHVSTFRGAFARTIPASSVDIDGLRDDASTGFGPRRGSATTRGPTAAR